MSESRGHHVDSDVGKPKGKQPKPTNQEFAAARLRTPSKIHEGKCMGRPELAKEINAYLAEKYGEGKLPLLDYRSIGGYENGRWRWPSDHLREAFRAVLGARTDRDLGFYTWWSRKESDLDDTATHHHDNPADHPPVMVSRAASSVEQWAQSAPGPSDAVPDLDLDVVHAAIPRLRRTLDRLDLPDDRPTRSLADLRSEVIETSNHRLQARYVDLARRLPDLIVELARAGQIGDSTDRRQAAQLLVLALRAADGVAFKFGYLDLSARLIDLMRSMALLAEDQLLMAVVSYVRTETFFASGDLGTAAHALNLAVDQVPTLSTQPMLSAAALGALHMRAAVVAGRAGNADAAAEHLREARRASGDVPEGVYHGTAFGPSSLRIHELAVAVELRDPLGIARAAAWQPPRELPAERRSHYYIDLARAQLALGQHEQAYTCIQYAREAAPQHARLHPQVRQSLSTLLRVHQAPDSRLLDLAAWARAR